MFYSNGAYSLFKVDTPVISGGATPPSFQDIYSYEFDGVDDYIDCNSASSSISADNEGTISVWIKADALANVIACISVSSSQKQFIYFGISVTTGGLQVQMKNDGGSSTGWILIQDTSLTLNTWHHLAVVQDGVEPVLYVDGVVVSQTFVISDNKQKWVNNFTGTANLLNIGRFKTSLYNQGYFDGLIDEFSYFSSALSSTDIETIWNNGVPNNLNDLSTLPTIWYRMGESASWDGSNWTLTDQGSGGNNATTQNMAEASRVLDVPPNPFANTKSILLDGIDDLVSMGDVLNMANDGTDAFSYSVWYKTTDTGSFQMFIGKQRASVWFNGVTFSMRGDLKNFNVFLGTGQGNQRIKGKTSTISDINDGNWHHVCLTYDGSQVLGGMTLYYDNTQIALSVDGTQGTPTNVSTSGQAEFIIGARGLATSPNLPFNGTIDEVSYFTSELSQSDVSTIYNSAVPNDISSLNPIGWWRCGDGDVSPILSDNGSGGNDGTMTNFSTFSTDVPT